MPTAAPPRLPPALPGFGQIARYWDPRQERFAAKILPGEVFVTQAGEQIVTVLGSCVSACVRDPQLGVGGMNHFMLPVSETGTRAGERADAWLATRYGNFAMESLINEILKRGGQRERLEVKLFGGGCVLAVLTDVGRTNIDFVQSYLQSEGITPVAEDLGGPHPRKVYYDPRSGRVRVRYLKLLPNDTLAQRELAYQRKLADEPVAGSVDLF